METVKMQSGQHSELLELPSFDTTDTRSSWLSSVQGGQALQFDHRLETSKSPLLPEHVEPLLIEHNVRFEQVKAERQSRGVDISDTQQGADILRLFLSITNKPRELLNKDITTPKRSIFKPLAILRKALTRGREQAQGWVLEPEYQFLYQLVGLPKACQSTGEYLDPFESRNVWLTQSHSSSSQGRDVDLLRVIVL